MWGAKWAEKSAVHPPRAVGRQRRVEGQGERRGERESVCVCVRAEGIEAESS